MKLLTKELKKRFLNVKHERSTDPIIVCKFFHPFSLWTWYATEYYDKNQEFFGYVDGDSPERWYFDLNSLEWININWLPIERDKLWKEKLFSDLILDEYGHVVG